MKVEVDEAKAHAMEAMEQVRSQKKEFEQIKRVKEKEEPQQQTMKKIETLEAEFEKLKVTTNPKNSKGKAYNAWSEGGKGNSATPPHMPESGAKSIEENKDLEMLVWGFEDNTPRKEIIEAMDKVLDAIPLSTKDTFTFEKSTNFGVIQFWNAEDKRWFKIYLMKNEIKHGDNTLSVSENLEKEQSRKERSCGKVKKALCNAGVVPEDIVVKYRRGLVELRRQVVAEWKDGRLSLSGRALELEGEIHKLLDEKCAILMRDSVARRIFLQANSRTFSE